MPPLPPLEIAAAGSLRSMLEGPLQQAATHSLHQNLQAHTAGADAVAQALIQGSLPADVFLTITPSPMLTLLRAGLAHAAQPFARTEMVLVYSPKSRFAAQLAAARNNPWQILAQPGFRFARSSPASDPSGRNIIFAVMLAARKYGQPDLVDRVLGPTLNPGQILPGANVQAMLASGEIDATGAYGIGPEWAHLPFLSLPADINLSSDTIHTDHPDLSFAVNGKTYSPEPLVFYAAALTTARHPDAAVSFLNWLQTPEAQTLLRQHHYGPSGSAPSLAGERV